MLAAALTFSVTSALVKELGDQYSPAVQAVYRQIAGLLVLLPLVLRHGRRAIAAHRPGLLAVRALGSASAMLLALYGIQKMPLAEASALSFTRVLWMAPLAVVMLNERVTPARFVATLLGFAGVLVMLQPTAGSFSGVAIPAAAMLTSAFLFAFTGVGMKLLTRDHSVTTIMIWSTAIGLLLTLPAAAYTWQCPSPGDLALLCTMGVLMTINQACYINALRLGDAIAMLSVDYSRLIFAALIGWAAFQEIPTRNALLGALLIIAATLTMSLHRQLNWNGRPTR